MEDKMRSNTSLIFAGTMFMAVSTAAAAPPPIVTQGEGAAIACASCHGVDGAGNAQAGFPVLAQLPPAQFTKQIADFKAGTRVDPIMTPIATAMSAEDIDASARHYASQARPSPAASSADPGVLARGKDLATNGAWDRDLPPCFGCHGTDGFGIEPAFPPIAGQHADYTAGQLQAWRSGARSNDPQELMKTVAEKLTDEEIQAVAEYLATVGTPGDE